MSASIIPGHASEIMGEHLGMTKRLQATLGDLGQCCTGTLAAVLPDIGDKETTSMTTDELHIHALHDYT